MFKRRNFLPTVIISVGVAVILLFISLFLSYNPIGSVIEFLVAPLQGTIKKEKPLTDEQKLQDEIKTLKSLLVDKAAIEKENRALRDQFESQEIKSQTLLPAEIIAAPTFIPGFSQPEKLILGVGKKDKVKVGQAVIYKNNVLGRIGTVSERMSSVLFITNDAFSLAVTVVPVGRQVDKQILGVLKGRQNQEMVLDNVVLSDDIKKGDMVTTYGESMNDGIYLPPDLILGQIMSVEKKPSALFQTARVKSLIDFTTLSTVFVVL